MRCKVGDLELPRPGPEETAGWAEAERCPASPGGRGHSRGSAGPSAATSVRHTAITVASLATCPGQPGGSCGQQPPHTKTECLLCAGDPDRQRDRLLPLPCPQPRGRTLSRAGHTPAVVLTALRLGKGPSLAVHLDTLPEEIPHVPTLPEVKSANQRAFEFHAKALKQSCALAQRRGVPSLPFPEPGLRALPGFPWESVPGNPLRRPRWASFRLQLQPLRIAVGQVADLPRALASLGSQKLCSTAAAARCCRPLGFIWTDGRWCRLVRPRGSNPQS